MTTLYDIVDLGTKHGNAIDEFRRRGSQRVLPAVDPKSWIPAKCLGIERPEAAMYRTVVENKGYRFQLGNLAQDQVLRELPPARVYLGWHFLEHLPNKDFSYLAAQAAMDKATELVWFRLPSFEPDDICGEGLLKRMDLRFTWTHWKGHTSRWLLKDAERAARDWAAVNPKRPFEFTIRPARYIREVADLRVVPINAPIDTNKYHPSLGPKPRDYRLASPIISEWEVTMRFKCKSEMSNYKILVPTERSTSTSEAD